jgi:hypothetical protein
MNLSFNTTEFVRTINFYKKQDNWIDILETAAGNVANDILEDAKSKVYQNLRKRTGRLAESIDVEVSASGNSVMLTLGSSHPAAAIIEYGGYSPMPPVYSESIQKYADIYGVHPGAVAKGIEKNQPFEQPRPFLRPALIEGRGAIEKEVSRVAKQMGP